MKNYEQLLEDARSDRELAEAISRAMQDYMRTDDRAALVTRLAEKGYEVTEKDIEPPKPADGETPFHDLTNISDDELKDVTGGIHLPLRIPVSSQDRLLQKGRRMAHVVAGHGVFLQKMPYAVLLEL